VFLRITLKKIHSINLNSSSAQVISVIIFSICYKGLEVELDKLARKNNENIDINYFLE
jgi:hypothetical protein